MTTEEAIVRIKNKGFTYVKFEVEFTVDGEYRSRSEANPLILRVLNRAFNNQISYFDGYEDNTVSYEYTFTVPTEVAGNIDKAVRGIVHVIRSSGYSVRDTNAGFHISLMTDGNIEHTRVDSIKYYNMMLVLRRLYPTLFCLASKGNGETRGLRYRIPHRSILGYIGKVENKAWLVNADEPSRYRAITLRKGYNNSLIEFRLFDPCLHKPSRAKAFLKTIALCLEYYKDEETNCPIPELAGTVASVNLKRNFSKSKRGLDFLLGRKTKYRTLSGVIRALEKEK